MWSFWGWSFVLPGISRRKVKNLKIPGGFQKNMSSTTLFFFFFEFAQYDLREVVPLFFFYRRVMFHKSLLPPSLNKLFSYFSSIIQDFPPRSEMESCGFFQVFIFKKIIRHYNLFAPKDIVPWETFQVTKISTSKSISPNCVITSSILLMYFIYSRLGAFRLETVSHFTGWALQIRKLR